MVEKSKLLLVDDEADFREIMAKFFSRRKIDVEMTGGCMESIAHP